MQYIYLRIMKIQVLHLLYELIYNISNESGLARSKPGDNKMATAKLINNDGRDWYKLNGIDYGTKYEFDDGVYGVTEDNTILDFDGYPLWVPIDRG